MRLNCGHDISYYDFDNKVCDKCEEEGKMSFKRNEMSNYTFGMMSLCQKTKMSKGECGCHPYPACSTCHDIGRVPPGKACPEGCQASIDVEKTREANRRKREIEVADNATLRKALKEIVVGISCEYGYKVSCQVTGIDRSEWCGFCIATTALEK